MPLQCLLPSHPLKEALSLLLYSDLPLLARALSPLLAGEMSACSVSHCHTDHTVWYSLVLCPPTLLVGPKTGHELLLNI